MPSRHNPIMFASHGCKYVHGSPRDGEWSYCGRPTVRSGSSWCEDHHAIVYGKSLPKRERPAISSPGAARDETVVSLEDPMLLG
jgi:hypothetical protein